ncbi:MAG: hemolysin family protein [Pseudomonadota bacterium]
MNTNSPSDENEPNQKKSGLFRRIKSVFARKNEKKHNAEKIVESLEKVSEELETNKREMLYKVASFDKLTVGDVMVPRADILAVEIDTNLGELARIMAKHQHSRLPIYRDSLDNPLGFVHVKDVLELLAPDENGKVEAVFSELPLSKIGRELVYVPLSMRLPNLLLQMRALRCHMALVVDEYGGTDGLITIEDLVEEIVGDIDDEHDDEEAPLIVERAPNIWEADAKLDLAEFHELTSIDLNLENMEDEIDTLGGLAFALAGRVPPRGEIIKHPNGFELEILDADPRSIKRILLRSASQAA